MPYCDICHSENCEHQDRSCPCGCGNNPRENCVYDTAEERHAKNMLNLKSDEQWVTDTLEMPCNTCGHSFSRHLTAGGFCKHCECVKFTRRTPRAPDAATVTHKEWCIGGDRGPCNCGAEQTRRAGKE